MKRARAFQVVKGVTGKVELKRREDGKLAPAIPRQAFDLDCGQAGIHTIRVSPGQTINPVKICKRLGGTYMPAPAAETKQDDASEKS